MLDFKKLADWQRRLHACQVVYLVEDPDGVVSDTYATRAGADLHIAKFPRHRLRCVPMPLCSEELAKERFV